MARYEDSRRRKLNDESKTHAENDRQIWGADEIAVLMDWDRSDDELDALAELLGRTREACRERYYQVLRGGGQVSETIRVTHTNTTEYHVSRWADADEWGDWYR